MLIRIRIKPKLCDVLKFSFGVYIIYREVIVEIYQWQIGGIFVIEPLGVFGF